MYSDVAAVIAIHSLYDIFWDNFEIKLYSKVLYKNTMAHIFQTQSICLIEINNYIEEEQNKRKCWKWNMSPKTYL